MVITCTYNTFQAAFKTLDEYKAVNESAIRVAKKACEGKFSGVIGSAGTYYAELVGGQEFNGICPIVDALETQEDRFTLF